ncbi:septum formation initiator family protein [Candidatus Nomurabacteria bacterium]|nr:septum formation initiator family protein [Candidatus Nomurabacteria bacterium]
MRNYERKITWRKVVESKPVLIFLGLLILVFAWSVLRFWNKMQETGQNKKIIEDKVTALREKKEKLMLDLESLNTEEGKEEFFRENYGLAKEGEQMIIIVEEKKLEKQEEEDSGGFFSFFRNLFK